MLPLIDAFRHCLNSEVMVSFLLAASVDVIIAEKKKLNKNTPDVGTDRNIHETDPGRPGLAGELGRSCAGYASRNGL